ncbi:hypothetical protein KGO95_03955 [Patescibacteria group bacterium]|nr:hypothetical protein [Patescibacteria group bacterium]
MIVIGLTGEKRGGKGTFTELLSQLLPHAKITRLGFGDIVGEICDILGLPRTRDNMQEVPTWLIEGSGNKGIITDAMKRRIEKLDTDIAILDGIRTIPDKTMLETLPHHLLVYVTASFETRYQRAIKAAEKVGDATLTREKFLTQDNAKIEQMIPAIGAKADYIIQNEGSLDDYRAHVEKVQRYFIAPAE